MNYDISNEGIAALSLSVMEGVYIGRDSAM